MEEDLQQYTYTRINPKPAFYLCLALNLWTLTKCEEDSLRFGDMSQKSFLHHSAARTTIIGLLNLMFKKPWQILAICSLLFIFPLKLWAGCCVVVHDSPSGSRLQDVVTVVAKLSIFHLHPEQVFAWFSLSLLMLHVSLLHNIDEIQK